MSFAGFRACLIYICLTVYEFSFILSIHHIILLILISVLSVTFWTLTYYKIYFFYHVLFDMKLLNYLFCDMFGSVLECYELTHISWLSTPGNHAWLNRHCYPIGCVIKSTHQGICSCSPIVNFFKFTFHHGMATSVIFLMRYWNAHLVATWSVSGHFPHHPSPLLLQAALCPVSYMCREPMIWHPSIVAREKMPP